MSTPNIENIHRRIMGELQAMQHLLTPQQRAEIDRLLFNPSKDVARYKDDPVAFAREVLHFEPVGYQEEILRAIVKYKRVCVRGPHGMGKSSISAIIILWFIATREECKIPTTASVWRQLIEFLWPEVHKWAENAEWWRVGLTVRPSKELMGQRLELEKNRVAFAISSSDEAKIEGAHSESILYVFDEAKTIPPAIWDAAEGALSVGDAYALAVSTPGESFGRFYDIQQQKEGFEDWHVIHVTKDMAIAAGRMNPEWAERRKLAWGEKSPMYQRRVEGNFSEDEADTVITLGSIEAAQERWKILEWEVNELIKGGKTEGEAVLEVWGPLVSVGVDPARFGEDRTGIALRHEKGIRRIIRTDREDTMQTANRVKKILDDTNAVANIDVNGLGAGVYDRLNEQECSVVSIMVTNRTDFTDTTGLMHFHQYRDWLWWNMRELLMNEGAYIALPPDDVITKDLLAAKWGLYNNGKIYILPKDQMRKALGRSPDAGESIIYSFAPPKPPYKPLISFF